MYKFNSRGVLSRLGHPWECTGVMMKYIIGVANNELTKFLGRVIGAPAL